MTETELRVETHIGSQIAPLLPSLAELRTKVFREFPYLYDGDEAYERAYLSVYSDNRRAMLATAMHGDTVVGASTCMPMIDAAPEARTPVEAFGLDPKRFFYFGESVLLHAYRGRGLGAMFFAAREAHALGNADCDHALFYAVRRADDHPARPAHTRPLNSFWQRRGFRNVPGLSCTMQWKEVGMDIETMHTLDAWIKPLRPIRAGA